uniref:Transposase n=1 Tax=Gongylonema pulchrum TaxID=637853 RepID=A0A183F1M6_9BILA
LKPYTQTHELSIQSMHIGFARLQISPLLVINLTMP